MNKKAHLPRNPCKYSAAFLSFSDKFIPCCALCLLYSGLVYVLSLVVVDGGLSSSIFPLGSDPCRSSIASVVAVLVVVAKEHRNQHTHVPGL